MATAKNLSSKTFVALATSALIAFGCGEVKTADDRAAGAASDATESAGGETVTPRFAPIELKMPTETLNASPESNAARNAYFGDLHVHTNYSFDAFAFDQPLVTSFTCSLNWNTLNSEPWGTLAKSHLAAFFVLIHLAAC